IKSKKYIYPACLGVENCGFTFGKILDADEDKLKDSFRTYSKYLKAYEAIHSPTRQEMLDIFHDYLDKDFARNQNFYEFLGINSVESAFELAKQCLTKDILKTACITYGSLGGGNHFFEIHKVIETNSPDVNKNDFFFILHSDSIAVGDRINLRYSNLSELDFIKNAKHGRKHIRKTRKRQLSYFIKTGLFFKNPVEVWKLIYSQKDYRKIRFDTRIGKRLLFEHNLARIFGEINRNAIINNWAKITGINIDIIASHCHDSVMYEKYDNEHFIIQRNGVQRVCDDDMFMLPSAMGNYSYLMKNPKNPKAFFSANHGTGRNQDKHIARDCYQENETISDMENDNILFCHIGNGNIAEQSKKAFKDVGLVLQEMKNYNLGQPIAKIKPIAIMKG
ncbi:MAG: RtcB family protein, partial [Alphaproteobacteria bacterium]|nr:RtcB family protein [Alphaproteobacteria bacterium]